MKGSRWNRMICMGMGLLLFCLTGGCNLGPDLDLDTTGLSKALLPRGADDEQVARICEEYGQPSPPYCDICEAAGWYGDGFCDEILIEAGYCQGPDTDCTSADN